MRIILVLFFFFFTKIFSFYSHADGIDYSANFAFRTVPAGGALLGELGYGKTLWEDKTTGFYKYGYVRPGFILKTSAVVNRPEIFFDLFPISLLGFRFGHHESFRSIDLNPFDCSQVHCKGKITTNYIRMKAIAGGEKWFSILNSELAFQHSDQKIKPYAEESSTLIGNNSKDRLLSENIVIGMNSSQSTNVGFYGEYQKMFVSKSANNLESIFYKKNYYSWYWMIGAGFYQSSLNTREPTVYLNFKWTGLPSLGF